MRLSAAIYPMTSWTTDEMGPSLYEPVEALETPVLLADVDAMERNIEEYAAVADDAGVALRSHVKTHKNAALAAREVGLTGGHGVCCQTLGEVETMARNGIDDVYLSYQVVGERKLDRLCWLDGTLDALATTVDSAATIQMLQDAAAKHDRTLNAILEIDMGLHRTGVDPNDAVELARQVQNADDLAFDGILAYDSHVKSISETEAEFEENCWEAMELAADVVAAIEQAGIPVDEVKVGGTATSRYSCEHPVVTEINPGMYPFNDVGELKLRPWEVSKDDCAATVLTTVISVPEEDRLVVDGGSKTFSLDKPQMPVPKNRDDIEYVNASEEHGWIDTSESEETFEVGDRLEFIVPHVCTTINLHDLIVGVSDGRVEQLWEVQARGKVR
jgi:D-serine deaminase-like pyridoxal phosphate-dependent protein